MLTNGFENINIDDLWEATYETFYMTITSLIGTFIIGILLGLLLFFTTKKGMWENKFLHFIIASFVNVFRAIPFIILIFLLFPFTNFLIRTNPGPNACLAVFIFGAGPFYCSFVKIAIKEGDKGIN